MTTNAPDTEQVHISLSPNEILINVVHALNGMVDDLTRPVPVHTTCNEAISHCQAILQDREQPLRLTPVRTWSQRQKLRQMAQAVNDPQQVTGPLKIRNALPSSQLPSPKRSTPHTRQVIKENFPMEATKKQPYNLPAIAAIDETSLASIPGEIKIFPMDGAEFDPTVEVRSDLCLWDTGAHHCIISADLVADRNKSFLDLPVHGPYRNGKGGVGVQVDAVFSFSNTTIDIATMFMVYPTSAIPNQRSGVILGQHCFMDRMVAESIPRSILEKRGETLNEEVWGEIKVQALIELDDNLRDFH